MTKVFLISFALTVVFYIIKGIRGLRKNRDHLKDLNYYQRRIALRDAKLKDYVGYAFGEILGSLLFPPVYIIAGIITFIYYLFSRL